MPDSGADSLASLLAGAGDAAGPPARSGDDDDDIALEAVSAALEEYDGASDPKERARAFRRAIRLAKGG